MKIINNVVTSKKAILTVCRELVATEGINSVNMRTVAQKCNVSVGSIYNYFPSKSDLISAIVEDVWHDILHDNQQCNQTESFLDYISAIFESINEGVKQYPDFFTAHSLIFSNTEKGKAQSMMLDCFQHIKLDIMQALKNDKRINLNVFTPNFTQDDFIEFIFYNIITLLTQEKNSCQTLLEIIQRIIYD